MAYLELKNAHRRVRDTFPDTLNLRIHRALSWFNHAEQMTDLDSRFIFYWIAFNAAYAQNISEASESESKQYNDFFVMLCSLDKDQHIYTSLWETFPQAIRVLLNNKYIFQPFWDFQNGQISQDAFLTKFSRANQTAIQALSAKKDDKVLGVVFSRLYTLRNQIVHGGATWNSKINRHQLRDGCAILAQMIPIIIRIMLANPHSHWGNSNYPVITP